MEISFIFQITVVVAIALLVYFSPDIIVWWRNRNRVKVPTAEMSDEQMTELGWEKDPKGGWKWPDGKPRI